MSFWLWCISWGWLYAMIVIGLFLTGYLLKNFKQMDNITKWMICAMIVLCFHVWEEWVLPGGFHWVYNVQHGSPTTLCDRYPMNRLTDMITNFGGELLGLIWLLVQKKFNGVTAVAIGIFSIFEFVIHVFITIKSQALYGGHFYAPGLLTATLGFLPVGLALLFHVIKGKFSLSVWLKGVILLVVLSIIFVNTPEGLLKNKNTRLGWTNHGYYEQFIR
ncbi:MAG: HXXEE domain-containing protein [Prevotella sp.]|jgi:hypothetical protein